MDALPTIRLDARAVITSFSRDGIPEGVRRKLRRIIPDLTKRLGELVERKLDTELKSRRRLKVDKEMREDSRRIIGVVRISWTGDSSKSFIPKIIETGAKAHPIFPRNAKALAFLWPKVGPGMFFFKKVWHPGFPGINALQRSFQEMEDEIIWRMQRATKPSTDQGSLRPWVNIGGVGPSGAPGKFD